MADADGVIELRAGEAKRLGLGVGDAVAIEAITLKSPTQKVDEIRPSVTCDTLM